MIFFCKDTKESQVAKIIGIRKYSSHAGLNKNGNQTFARHIMQKTFCFND